MENGAPLFRGCRLWANLRRGERLGDFSEEIESRLGLAQNGQADVGFGRQVCARL